MMMMEIEQGFKLEKRDKEKICKILKEAIATKLHEESSYSVAMRKCGLFLLRGHGANIWITNL